LVVKHKLNNTENQFEAIREGFYDIIPKEINTIINEFDLKVIYNTELQMIYYKYNIY